MGKDKKNFFRFLAQTSPFPLAIEIEKAEGIYLHSPDGKKYMDLISGLAVTNIGHRHPRVIKAIEEQLDRYMHIIPYGEFVLAPQITLAEKLISLLPPSLNNVYLVNSGTEANEGAIKLAKRFTGRTEIISYLKSYHGSTQGSMSISGNEIKKNSFRPLIPGIRLIRFNEPEDLKYITSNIAGVIIEPIQGDAGVRIPGKDYMNRLYQRCKETGTLLIFDEVQTGFGRTGKMFAFEHFDITPDILSIAKAFGGGLPLGAFVSSRKIMSSISHDPMLGHITTFGGNPVACAAAIANIDIIQEEHIIDGVEEKGRLFESLIKHPAIKEIRRIGLMMAVEFDNEEIVYKIVNNCLEDGVITFWFLSTANSFRLSPPLNISRDEIGLACRIILQAIERSIKI